jgi:hypothetical protein
MRDTENNPVYKILCKLVTRVNEMHELPKDSHSTHTHWNMPVDIGGGLKMTYEFYGEGEGGRYTFTRGSETFCLRWLFDEDDRWEPEPSSASLAVLLLYL